MTEAEMKEALELVSRSAKVLLERDKLKQEITRLQAECERMRESFLRYINHEFCDCGCENCEGCAKDCMIRVEADEATLTPPQCPRCKGTGQPTRGDSDLATHCEACNGTGTSPRVGEEGK